MARTSPCCPDNMPRLCRGPFLSDEEADKQCRRQEFCSDGNGMLAPTLRTLRNILLAHLAGTYVTLLVFFVAGASVPDQALKSPLMALLMLQIIYPISLPLVLPFAVLSLFVINRYGLLGRWTFMLAGAVLGLCSILIMGYFMPGLWRDGPYNFVSRQPWAAPLQGRYSSWRRVLPRAQSACKGVIRVT